MGNDPTVQLPDTKIEAAIDQALIVDKKATGAKTEAFMEPEVAEGDWYEVDSPQGVQFLPIEILGEIPELEKVLGEAALGETVDWSGEIPESLRMYLEGDEIWTIAKVHGWGARMTAPGYLDATEWTVFETEEEARQHLADENEELEDEMA